MKYHALTKSKQFVISVFVINVVYCNVGIVFIIRFKLT